MRERGDLPEEGDAAGGTRRGAVQPAASRAAVVAPSLAASRIAARAASVEPVTRDAVDTTRSDTPAVTRDAVPAERDASPTTRRHRVNATPIGDAVDDEVARSKVRSRGWVGRGPVGATVVKAPPWLKRKVADRKGGRVPMWARTNATWWRYGTKAYAWSDRLPPRFAFWPRLLQLAAQALGVVLLVASGWAWISYPVVASWVASLLSGAVLAAVGWTLATAVMLYPHRRRWVKPTAQVLAPVLGYPDRTPDRRWLKIPEGFALDGGQIEVALPPDFVSDGNDDQAKEILAKLRAKLCLRDVQAVWQLDGRNHTAIVRSRTPTKPVPSWARFSSPYFREVVEGLGDSELVIGLSHGLEPITFDLDTENPHVLLAVGSGGGKSECLKNFGAQLMHRGALAELYDFKYTSHEWARDIAMIYRSIAQIHCGLVALGKECEKRNRDANAALEAGLPRPRPPRKVVLIDEAPMTIALLNLWWSVERKSLTEYDVATYGDPAWKRSPAVMGIFSALTMGRERNMNVGLVSQIANANEIGGSAIRGMLGLRIIGRQPMSVWKMIAPEIDHPPVCSRHPGRLYPVMDGQVFETQGGYWTDDEARAWAIEGAPRSRGRVVAQTPLTRTTPRDHATGDTGTPVIDVTERLVSLKRASSDQGESIVPYTYQTLRKWQAKGVLPDPDEPAKARGRSHLYRPDRLVQFHEEKVEAKGRAS